MQPTSGTAPASYSAEPDGVDGTALHPPNQARHRPTPRFSAATTWAKFYAENLPDAMGYAWAVSRNGELVDSGASGAARSVHSGAPLAWTTDVVCNLASVSKTTTAIAIMAQAEAQGWSLLDEPAWTFLSKRSTFTNPGKGVPHVSIWDLLTMMSGLNPKVGLNFKKQGKTRDELIAAYLQECVVNPPGQVNVYSNANFAILQIVYEILMGAEPDTYTSLMQENVFGPMGVDGFVSVPPTNAALCYAGKTDASPGHAWPEIHYVGAGGWLASANQFVKYMNGIRQNKVLSPEATNIMLGAHLGWYPYVGKNGVYYNHDGNVNDGGKEITTGAIRLADGFDAVLLVNSPVPNIIGLMAAAFDATRGSKP